MRRLFGLFLAVFVLGFGAPLAAQVTPPQTMPGPSIPGATQRQAAPKTYGGSVESRLLVPAVAFLPQSSGEAYNGFNLRYVTTNNLYGLLAPLQLPSGAKVVSLELDYYDGAAAGAEYVTLAACPLQNGGCFYYPTVGDGPGDCNIAGYVCSGTANAPGLGSFHDTLIANDGVTIDNSTNAYLLFAYNTTTDGFTQLAGVAVGYVLQVSPPPATADFTDVPTSHPFFQFIEALYHSGITAGCGGGNFCPNSPLTRGQMAVFLAKALGLQFP
jgi:hypothetical protein